MTNGDTLFRCLMAKTMLTFRSDLSPQKLPVGTGVTHDRRCMRAPGSVGRKGGGMRWFIDSMKAVRPVCGDESAEILRETLNPNGNRRRHGMWDTLHVEEFSAP